MPPIVNLLSVTLQEEESRGLFQSRWANLSEGLGAQRLGYNLTELPPGKAMCPFHSHRVEEEVFLILEGEGVLRYGSERHPLKPMDLVACPPGGPETAHQILNTGDRPMRYLALSTRAEADVCEYPDSGKVMAMTGPQGRRTLRKMFRAGSEVDYFDGEADAGTGTS